MVSVLVDGKWGRVSVLGSLVCIRLYMCNSDELRVYVVSGVVKVN